MLTVNIYEAKTQFSKLIEALGRGIAAPDVYVSSASIWEASIKASLDKLDVDTGRLVAEISNSGFEELAVSARHAAKVACVPDIHRAPFDRMLVAQAAAPAYRVSCPPAIRGAGGDDVVLD